MPESDDKNTVQMMMGKMDSMHYKMQELTRLSRQGKLMSFIVVLAIAGAAFLSLFRTYVQVRSYPPRMYSFYMQKEAEKLRPLLETHLNQMVKNVTPSYQEAFQKEFVDRMPEISEAANKEASLFLQNIGDRFEARLNKAVKKIVDEHALAMAKDHPLLKNEAAKAKVIEQSEEIYYSAAEEVARSVFHDQTKAIADLGATIETYESPEHLKNMNDEKLIQHTLDTLMSILARRLSFVELPNAPASADDSTRKAR